MALKKDIRSDNTYIISQDTTDNPKLGAKILSDGRESLFLDYYFGYRMEYSEKLGRDVAKKDRKREYLSLYLWQAPRTPLERQQNKEMLEIAKRIRFERGQQMLESAEGYRLKKNDDINFLDWFWSYYEAYTKADKRHIKRAYTVFVDFLKATPEYSKYAKRIKPSQLIKRYDVGVYRLSEIPIQRRGRTYFVCPIQKGYQKCRGTGYSAKESLHRDNHKDRRKQTDKGCVKY